MRAPALLVTRLVTVMAVAAMSVGHQAPRSEAASHLVEVVSVSLDKLVADSSGGSDAVVLTYTIRGDPGDPGDAVGPLSTSVAGVGGRVSGDASEGTYRYTYTIGSAMEQGLWTIRVVSSPHAAVYFLHRQATAGDESPGGVRELTTKAQHEAIAAEWREPAVSGSASVDAYLITVLPVGVSYTVTWDGFSWVGSGPDQRNRARSGVYIDGLTNGAEYSVEVRAVTEHGIGPPVGSSAREAGTQQGYYLLTTAGALHTFGDAMSWGDLAAIPLTRDIVDMCLGPNGRGYTLISDEGANFTFGPTSCVPASPGALALRDGESFVAIQAHPAGQGSWAFTSHGRVITGGSEPGGLLGIMPLRHHGDLLAHNLNGRVIAAIATPTGGGYYMLGSDGGVFAFGDAAYWGSIQQLLNDTLGGVLATEWLNAPIVGIVPTPSGLGYWLVAADGGVFAFGDAWFVGSIPGVLAPGATLNAAIDSMVTYGDGYLMVAKDGGVFNFSNQPFEGSLGANPPSHHVIAVAPLTPS